ncbi:MAG: hypothetical protein ACRDTN_17860 [Mycobacterium sp.]
MRWLHEIDEDRTYLSVITIGEVRKGVERLVDSPRRNRLGCWPVAKRPEHRLAGLTRLSQPPGWCTGFAS